MPPTSRTDSIPVETLQQALSDSGISQHEIARRMGWYRQVPDITKIRRALGNKRSGGRPKQRHVTYERAQELIVAMGLDPTDYGL